MSLQTSNQPTQAPTSTGDWFVEGYTETYGPEQARFAFNLSPASPYVDVFIFGDAVRGFDVETFAY